MRASSASRHDWSVSAWRHGSEGRDPRGPEERTFFAKPVRSRSRSRSMTSFTHGSCGRGRGRGRPRVRSVGPSKVSTAQPAPLPPPPNPHLRLTRRRLSSRPSPDQHPTLVACLGESGKVPSQTQVHGAQCIAVRLAPPRGPKRCPDPLTVTVPVVLKREDQGRPEHRMRTRRSWYMEG